VSRGAKTPLAETPVEGRGEVGWEGLRSVHLIAIAGVGMTALAGLLKARGVAVRGSDEQIYPPMSDVLAAMGVEVVSGHRAENLTPRPDLVIVGNKVSRGNPEAQALLASDIPYLSMPAALGRLFLSDKRSLVVAGTHGKSTSTAMLANVLRSAGRDPSMMVGGHALDFGGNFAAGGGEHFVIEGDEYDSAFFDKRPKFVHYRPAAAILTAVEFDHADIYADLAAVKASFHRFVELLPAGAPLVVNTHFPHAFDIARGAARCRLETFGGGGARWSYDRLRDDGERTRFRVLRDGAAEGEVALRAPGAINVWNALGVYVLARVEGLTHAEVAAGIESFHGVARRQELVGVFAGVTLIDDFAHHPTAVAGVLSALRERYRERRLWALFEPRSNTSRRAIFQQEYARALAVADEVVLARVFRKESDVVDAAEELSAERLIGDLGAAGRRARLAADSSEIADLVVAEARPGDVVVMMSNGAFGGLRGYLAGRLAAR
jgi:UDP-N-acetylmuramate: L-alanyl-gamma-D-glutamyl-meso-diaminopimelate ligase